MADKVHCANCGKLFYPDSDDDIYCCEACLDEAEGNDENDEE